MGKGYNLFIVCPLCWILFKLTNEKGAPYVLSIRLMISFELTITRRNRSYAYRGSHKYHDVVMFKVDPVPKYELKNILTLCGLYFQVKQKFNKLRCKMLLYCNELGRHNFLPGNSSSPKG
jgi:hypothetical protein